jgi:putative glutathione S-transferase
MAQAQFGPETSRAGAWTRQASAFRRHVGTPEHPVEAGRYHLYVSRACPWAHRAIIARRLKGLERAIGMTVVDPIRDERGWRFGHGDPASGEPDPVNGWRFLREAYDATDPSYAGRVSVPVLWDTTANVIVSNESADVLRMLGSAFDEVAEHPELDLYPTDLREEIDELNEWVYETVNNGVYRCGFATTQTAYEDAFDTLFASLDRLDAMLGERRYLTGDRLTEADWRLFTTLVRFDAVYHGHFKCNLRRLVDHDNLWPYARELYQHDGIADTVDLDHIKRHYYVTHDQINPNGIVPKGPEVDWLEPHGRG